MIPYNVVLLSISDIYSQNQIFNCTVQDSTSIQRDCTVTIS